MPALKNPKHEAFCQAFVRGEHAGNGAGSYKAVYGKENRAAASRVLHRRDVSQRVAELQGRVAAVEEKATERAIEKLAITKEAVLSELARIGFSNMLDYVRVNDFGDAVVDFSRLDRDKATAIQEVTVDTYQESGEDGQTVKRVKFKLADKRAALVDIGKHLGMFVERREVTHKYGDKTDADLTERLGAIVDQLSGLGIDLRALGGDELDHGGTPPTSRPN